MEQKEVGVGGERTEEREERHANISTRWGPLPFHLGEGGWYSVPFHRICMGMHNFWKAKEGTFEKSILNH